MINNIDRRFATDAEQMQLSAYNAAFYELGLRWHWDAVTYQALSPCADDKSRIRTYIETMHPHLLTAYDVDSLAGTIQATKTRCYESLTACGARMAPAVDWAAMQVAEVGF